MCMNDCMAENELKQLKQDIREIRDCLLGNDFTENKGMVHRIKFLEDQHTQFIQKQNYKIGFAAGIGTLIGAFFGFLINLIIK